MYILSLLVLDNIQLTLYFVLYIVILLEILSFIMQFKNVLLCTTLALPLVNAGMDIIHNIPGLTFDDDFVKGYNNLREGTKDISADGTGLRIESMFVSDTPMEIKDFFVANATKTSPHLLDFLAPTKVKRAPAQSCGAVQCFQGVEPGLATPGAVAWEKIDSDFCNRLAALEPYAYGFFGLIISNVACGGISFPLNYGCQVALSVGSTYTGTNIGPNVKAVCVANELAIRSSCKQYSGQEVCEITGTGELYTFQSTVSENKITCDDLNQASIGPYQCALERCDNCQ